MSGNVRQTPPEPTCGTLWVTSDNSPTFDGTGPQNAPEGTEDMNSIDNLREWVDNNCCLDNAEVINDRLDEIEREVADMVPLPVDADGVPIHVGDVLDGYGKTIEVVELRYGRSGWVLISRDGNAYADCAAFTHHHAPTVEDVLREFADEVQRCCDTSDTIAEYAAKLRLAEGVDA